MPMEYEQLARESNKAYEAFNLYLHMGPARSTVAVAKQLGKSKQLIQRWCQRHGWLARVQVYNAHLALVERQSTEEGLRSKSAEWLARQEALREEEWAARGELLRMAREHMQRWKANPRRCGSLEGIVRMLELASKLGRLSSGMPTNNTEVKEEVTATLDPEWEMALQRVYGKQVKPEPPVVLDAEVLADGCMRTDTGGKSGDQRSEVKGQVPARGWEEN